MDTAEGRGGGGGPRRGNPPHPHVIPGPLTRCLPTQVGEVGTVGYILSRWAFSAQPTLRFLHTLTLSVVGLIHPECVSIHRWWKRVSANGRLQSTDAMWKHENCRKRGTKPKGTTPLSSVDIATSPMGCRYFSSQYVGSGTQAEYFDPPSPTLNPTRHAQIY